MLDSLKLLLLASAVVLAVGAGLLHPRKGAIARFRGGRLAAEKARLEDALKHLHNSAWEGRAASVESLAGQLGISREDALDLLGRVERMGLLTSTGGPPELTTEGEAYALRIIRNHRLWERYLAEHTGVHHAEWHDQAERREHTLTADEAQELSVTLGHPRYDPHGDPIPGQDGTLPPARGVPLPSLEPGDVGVVLHVEDEPRRMYDRLVGAGMSPGARVEVLPADGTDVRVRVAGREQTLEPFVAAHVAVEAVAPEEREEGIETLADIRPGDTATVVRIAPACRGPQRRRLLDLGLVPGTRVESRYGSMSGDPVAYEIRGALIALRRNQAEQILVRRIETVAAPGRTEPSRQARTG